MKGKGLEFSGIAKEEIGQMSDSVIAMFDLSERTFSGFDKSFLPQISQMENTVDEQKKTLSAKHFARLTEGACRVELSPYYSSTIVGLERVADHLLNVSYSIVNPVGAQD